MSRKKAFLSAGKRNVKAGLSYKVALCPGVVIPFKSSQ